MSDDYNRVAGLSVERLAALSDGIFAVAMTLLVLDLHVPAKDAVATEADLAHSLGRLAPGVLVYALSFLTLGIFWVGQQTQMVHLARSDRHLTWLHLAFLFAVTVTPFSTRLLADFTGRRVALLVYWANLLALGGLLYACWGRSVRAGLLSDNCPAAVPATLCRRIIVAQSLYAAGAALCAVSTYLSIAAILVVQLNYAVAPRFGRPAAADR